jgi:tetratricopeptide (TPR) repeat protein
VPKQSSSPTFLIASWLLALIAFAQLVLIAAAMTSNRRVVAIPETIVAPLPQPATHSEPIRMRSVDEILASIKPDTAQARASSDTGPNIRSDTGIQASEESETINDNATISVVSQSVPVFTPSYDSTFIADPVVEKLIAESRALQLDGDMMRAMLKLDEAARRDPSEAAVIYNKGLLYEEMGLYTQAADQYQAVQQMGISAGSFFKLSAKKLTKGMDAAHANRPAISIGPMNLRHDNEKQDDQQVNLAITILARPDKSINPSDVSVQVHFYDKLENGEIKKANSRAKISEGQWDGKVDWKGPSHEETVNVSYTIAEADLAQAHLFGRRQYYGHVVELYYKNKVIDQQATPRRLNSIHGNQVSPLYNQSRPWLPGDRDTLLPGKDEFNSSDNLTLPKR